MMETYETAKGVAEYIKMCEGYDNSGFSEIIQKYLPQNSTLLELGMGPGNDYAWLSKLYRVTGSDYSKEFITRVQARFPAAETILLDAISLEIDKHFDAIFSSKVFQHFNYSKLRLSFKRQYEILNPKGIFCHAFWVGDKEFDMANMHFVYHAKDRLIEMIEKDFTILECVDYKEFEDNDSVFFIARKK